MQDKKAKVPHGGDLFFDAEQCFMGSELPQVLRSGRHPPAFF